MKKIHAVDFYDTNPLSFVIYTKLNVKYNIPYTSCIITY